MKTTPLIVLLALSCSHPALCQLAQLHPELCGTPNAVVALPPAISAMRATGYDLNIFLRSGAPGIPIPGPLDVEEVCPLPDGRLVVFGNMMTGKSFSIVDPAKPSTIDTVWGYDPLLSPDQKWIVFRKFFPRQTDEPASDEYLRYDLSRTPAQNRSPGVGLDWTEEVGTAIYPLGWKNELADNIGAPEDQQHHHLSTFFWAPDSRALVFADVNQGKRSVVLITIDEKGATTASVSPFPDSMECDDPAAAAKGKKAQPTGLRHVEFAPQQGPDRLMFVDFEADGCAPKTQQLHTDSFQPAKTEPRVLEPPTRKTIKHQQ